MIKNCFCHNLRGGHLFLCIVCSLCFKNIFLLKCNFFVKKNCVNLLNDIEKSNNFTQSVNIVYSEKKFVDFLNETNSNFIFEHNNCHFIIIKIERNIFIRMNVLVIFEDQFGGLLHHGQLAKQLR